MTSGLANMTKLKKSEKLMAAIPKTIFFLFCFCTFSVVLCSFLAYYGEQRYLPKWKFV